MIRPSRACTISLHFEHLLADELGNYTVSSLCPIRLEMENLGELALRGKIKKIWKKNISSSWRKVMLNILGFRFSKFEIFENPKIFIFHWLFHRKKIDFFWSRKIFFRLFRQMFLISNKNIFWWIFCYVDTKFPQESKNHT